MFVQSIISGQIFGKFSEVSRMHGKFSENFVNSRKLLENYHTICIKSPFSKLKVGKLLEILKHCHKLPENIGKIEKSCQAIGNVYTFDNFGLIFGNFLNSFGNAWKLSENFINSRKPGKLS